MQGRARRQFVFADRIARVVGAQQAAQRVRAFRGGPADSDPDLFFGQDHQAHGVCGRQSLNKRRCGIKCPARRLDAQVVAVYSQQDAARLVR